jgi:hypothetical protein
MTAKTLVKGTALVTLLLFVVAASGCYGGFQLTKALYKFNGEVKLGEDPKANRVAQSAVMILLVIIPVYQLAALADAVIINSIEFWTGKNPMQANAEPVVRTVARGSERYVQTFVRTASVKEMRIEYFKQDRHVNTLTLRQEQDSPTVTADLYWSDGRHERYQIGRAGGESYLIGHTGATGTYQQWLATPDQVTDLSRRVQASLGASVAAALPGPAPRFR